MSPEEQHTILGRTLHDYQAARSELAALLAKASRFADQLSEAAVWLRQSGPSGYRLAEGLAPNARQATAIEQLPNPDEVRDLLAEIKAAAERKRQLRQTLADAGIELKED